MRGEMRRERVVQHTLVSLLLDLSGLREVLVLLPPDLSSCGSLVDYEAGMTSGGVGGQLSPQESKEEGGGQGSERTKVSSVANLLLVVVGLLKRLVLKELVLTKDERELEPGLGVLEVRQLDVLEVGERGLVLLGDELDDRARVLERRQPELRNTGHLVLARGGGLVDLGNLAVGRLAVGVATLGVGSLAGLDLLGGGLDLTGDDGRSSSVDGLVKGSELTESGRKMSVRWDRLERAQKAEKAHPLLESEDLKLELSLNLGVLDLETLETVDPGLDLLGEAVGKQDQKCPVRFREVAKHVASGRRTHDSR